MRLQVSSLENLLCKTLSALQYMFYNTLFKLKYTCTEIPCVITLSQPNSPSTKSSLTAQHCTSLPHRLAGPCEGECSVAWQRATCLFTRLESLAWVQQGFWQPSFCRKPNFWSFFFYDGNWSGAYLHWLHAEKEKGSQVHSASFRISLHIPVHPRKQWREAPT